MDRQGCGIHFCHTHGMIISLSAGIMSRIIVSSAAQSYSCSPASPRCEQRQPTGREGIQRFDPRELARLPQSLTSKPRLFCNPARAAERASSPKSNSGRTRCSLLSCSRTSMAALLGVVHRLPALRGEAVAIDDVVPLRRNAASRAGFAGASASRYAR